MIAAAMMSDRAGGLWRGFQSEARAITARKSKREKNTDLLERFHRGHINVLVATSGKLQPVMCGEFITVIVSTCVVDCAGSRRGRLGCAAVPIGRPFQPCQNCGVVCAG